MNLRILCHFNFIVESCHLELLFILVSFLTFSSQEDVAILQKRSTSKDLADADRIPSSPSLIRKTPAILLQRKQPLATTATATAAAAIKPASTKKLSSNIAQADNAIPITSRSTTTSSIHSEAQKNNVSGKISSSLQGNATSRPASAPLIPALRPTASITTTLQTVPLLSRSVSSAGRLGTASSASASAPSNVPQSYKNAIIGKLANASSSQSVACSQSPSEFASSASTLPQTPSRNEHMPSQSGLTFGCLNPEVVTSLHPYRDNHYEFATSTSSSSTTYNSQSFGSLVGNMEKLNPYGNPNMQYPDAIGSRVCPQPQDTVVEEFPHLDIINDLLNEDENIGRTNMSSSHIFSRNYSLPVNYSNGETRLLVSSSQFGQSENHYGEGFQRGYDGASSNLLHRIRDEHFRRTDHSSYTNSMFDRSMQKQLPYRNTDPLMFNLTNGDANEYAHQLPYYMARGGNGFLYRPNGP